MDAGKRNRRIAILEYQEIKDEEGIYKKNWIEKSKLWAYIKPLSGSELFTAQANEYKVSVKVNIRYNKTITEYLRVKIQDDIYKIAYIEDVDFAHKEMWLNLEKVI